jgi:hypothetical protein
MPYCSCPFRAQVAQHPPEHRALPCAIAHKAFSLSLMLFGRISDIHFNYFFCSRAHNQARTGGLFCSYFLNLNRKED